MSQGHPDDDPVLAELAASPERRATQLTELQEFADHELTLYGHADGRTFLLCRSLGGFAARESHAIENGGSGKRLVIAGDVFRDALADPKVPWARLINRRDPRVVGPLEAVRRSLNKAGMADFDLFAQFYRTGPGKTDGRPPHDVILVLAGSFAADGSFPPHVVARLRKALDVYRGHNAPVVTSGRGGRATAAGERERGITQCAAMRDWLVQNGVPPEAVSMEDRSTDTLESLVFTRRSVLDPAGYRAPAVVTSQYHVPRAFYIADWILGDAFAPRFVAAPNEGIGIDSLEDRREVEEALLGHFLANLYPKVTRGDLTAIDDFLFERKL